MPNTHNNTASQTIFILIVLIVFFGIRLVNLPERVHFASDEGRDFLVVWEMYQNKEPTLIGPPSEFKINGREFYFGPAPYYVILPALVLGHWDILAVSYLLIVINVAAVLFALLTIDTYIKDKRVLYSFASFATFTPAFIAYSQSYWNPHFMLPVSFVLLGFLIRSKHIKSLALLNYVLIGFLFGLGMQFHYSFIFAVLIGFSWLFKTKRLSIRSFLCILAGGFIGFLPVILFELRNSFYNISTLFLVLSNSTTALSEAKFHSFYLISTFPFIIYFIATQAKRIKNDRVLYILISLYIVICLAVVISVPKQPLSYQDLTNLTALIHQDNPTNFNIVDQQTGDNRAMALRYFLTAKGSKPQGVTEYPDAKTLYIYSTHPLNTLLKDPIWEVKSFNQYIHLTTRKVTNELSLYKLEK